MYYVDSQGNVRQVVSATEVVALVDPTEVPKHQANVTIIANALTNINGRVLSSYEATDVIVSGYPAKKITYGGAKLTEERASAYMEYMTGSVFLPKYNYEKPQNSIFLMSDYTMWKPQYDNTNGLLLFKIGKLVKQAELDDLQSEVDELKAIIGEVVIESEDLTFNNLDFSALPSAVDSKSIVFSAGMDLKEIKGNSTQYNQLVPNGDFESLSRWGAETNVTMSINDNVLTFVGTNSSTGVFQQKTKTMGGHKLFGVFKAKSLTTTQLIVNLGGQGGLNVTINNTWTLCGLIASEITTSQRLIGIYSSNSDFSIDLKDVMVFDLTAMGIDTNDVDVAKAELLKRGIDVNVYNEYNEGTIVNSKPIKIITKDSNNNVLGQYPLSCPILRSAGSVKDTDKKVNVGVVDLGSLEWGLSISEANGFYANLPLCKPDTSNSSCSKYVTGNYGGYQLNILNIASQGGVARLFIKDTNYATTEAFKTSLNGVMLNFELETPTDQQQVTLPEDIKIQERGTIEVEYDEDDYTPSDFDFEVAVSRLEA